MAIKICHLCGTNYEDDPFFREQPAHTPEKCLGMLWYRFRETEVELTEIKRQLARAEREYKV